MSPDLRGHLAAAIAATAPAELLPHRSQARAAHLAESGELIDALELGNGAWVAVVAVGDRTIICPGRVLKDRFVRAPEVAVDLRVGAFGSFSVDLPHGSLTANDVQFIDVDQTNDSVICDDTVVKWQLDAQPSPAPRALRAVSDANVTPRVRALVEWTHATGEVCTLATASDYLEGAEDGWTWAVDLVRAHARGAAVDALEPFAQLGRMTARMHIALAALGVSAWDADQCSVLAAQANLALDEALRVTTGEEGQRLRERSTVLRDRLAVLDDIRSTPVLTVHGDLHVGQVLRAPSGEMAIIDFDGNPLLPPAQRMDAAPAARDVAGMLASIDHVARVVNYRTEDLDPRPALIWIAHAQDAFLAEYQNSLRLEDMRDLLDDRLLPPFLIEQECREYMYAAQHLPHWVYVPDAVISAIPVSDAPAITVE